MGRLLAGREMCRLSRRRLQRLVGRRVGRVLAEHLDICLQRFGKRHPTSPDPNADPSTTLPSDESSEEEDEDDDDGK